MSKKRFKKSETPNPTQREKILHRENPNPTDEKKKKMAFSYDRDNRIIIACVGEERTAKKKRQQHSRPKNTMHRFEIQILVSLM